MLEFLRRLHAKDIELTDRYLGRTPFHPSYWVNVRIARSISENASSAHGIILDVGCGLKPYRKNFERHVDAYIGMEYSLESGYRGNSADFCGDATLLPVADASIDTILCTEVLEHLANPEKAVSEFARVLRSGGTLITTAPFAFPVHDESDFFRYAPKGVAALMSRHGLIVEKVEALSGTAVTLAVLFNVFLFCEMFQWNKFLYPIGLLARPLIWILSFIINVVGGLLEFLFYSESLPFDHITVGVKKSKI